MTIGCHERVGLGRLDPAAGGDQGEDRLGEHQVEHGGEQRHPREPPPPTVHPLLGVGDRRFEAKRHPGVEAGAGGEEHARPPGVASAGSRRAVDTRDGRRSIRQPASASRSASVSVLERLDDEVGVGEVVVAGDAAGHRHGHHAGRLGRGHAVAESSSATLRRGVGAEVGARAEVDVGRRLAHAADEVRADEGAEAVEQAEAIEVPLEPADGGRRGHPDRHAARR